MDMRMMAPTFSSVVVVKKADRWKVSTYGKAYAGLVLLESVGFVILCLLSLFYARSHASEELDASSVEYTSIVALVTAVAFLYFSIDSIVLENIFQFWASLVLHALITAYVVWHYVSGADLGILYNRISLWVMVCVCAFQLAYLALIYPVQESFGWRLYKRIGGATTLRPLYRTATMFFSLLKLDATLGCILVLLAVFYLLSDPLQIALNCLGLLATLGWLLIGFLFVRREAARLAPIFFAFSVLEPSFLIYKLVAMKLHSDAEGTPEDDSSEYPVFSWNEFLLTGCVAVAVRVLAILNGIACWRNFGQGLKERIFDDESLAGVVVRGNAATATAGHTQAPELGAYAAGQPVAVVAAEDPGLRSGLRNYLQPLL